ncbi:MAG: benzoate-CoA ligase family protein [Halobacteriales archaeon]|nr:benzoate-CoA ligase family protein [Halobacteriales archaeon]
MQPNIPTEKLPAEEAGPTLIHPLPELHYPHELNAAVELVQPHLDAGHGDDVAIYFEDTAMTYAELEAATNRLGNVLRDLGVEPGDRVFVRFPNRPEYVVACLAVQKIGAISLPSMKLLRAKEIEYVLSDSGASAAVVYDGLLEEVLDADAAADTLEEIVVVEDTGVEHDHHSYAELTGDASEELEPYETSRDDLAMMAYTSGTTGRPKGTIHTHRQVLASCDTYARYCLQPSREDVFSGNPPIAFTYGYGMLVAFPLRFGASTAIVEDAAPADLLDAIERYGVSVLASVPTAYNQMLAGDDPAGDHDLSSLRLCVSAGEPLPEHTYERITEHLGVEATDGIGTTEMFHVFISHRADDEMDPTATGFSVPGYECKVVDPETGEEVERGEAGLLLVRGPTGITYWDRPEVQADAVRDGWSRPGDIFVHREDGRLEYQSRHDDLIITAGNNVPGPEVEGVLEEREEVFESAVIGKPDEERGQIVKAYVVLADGVEADAELTETLQDYVKGQIAPYKYPREVEYVAELPKTETGKIQRAELREREQG